MMRNIVALQLLSPPVFSPSFDIDWSKSIPDINQQCYTKYGITDYQAFIESIITPMEIMPRRTQYQPPPNPPPR